MTPILYEKDEIDFTSQGLGSLVEIYDVDVEEQRNGLLQLTASYPVSGVRYADISVGRIILAKPNQRDDVHAFRIVSTELDISGYAVTVEADSITYDLTHNLVKHLVVSGNGQSFMTALKNAVVNPSIFAFYSDIATSSTTSLNYVNPMEAIMGTTGSFLQIWGGELKRENRRVAMFNRRGRDNVATFRLGKNISGLKYSVDISSLVTRIIPTKSVQNDDQTTTTLEGTPVDSQYINNYEQIYTLPLEFTDDTIKTVADLNAAAKGWFTQSANTGRDKPTVTIDIDVLSLQDSAGYQDKFKNLESVSLTDTVTVYVPEYGVNVTAIVNELHYDPILDRVTKMTVGTAKQSFADSSRTQLSDLQDKIISVQNQADATAVSANGKNKNYYGSVQPSHPQEGDQWYWQDGDKSGIKQFINGEWMPLIDSNTQEKIEAGVNEAIAQANENTATTIEQNNISQQEVMNDIAKSQADLAIKDGDFNNKAQAMADKALSDAKANTATVAKETLDTATDNLNSAKQSLTTDLQKEISDRTDAVATLDTKAKGYADQAKQDAIDAANDSVNKEVADRNSAISALDTKSSNAIGQAKTDITQTINALTAGSRNYWSLSGRTIGSYIDVDGTIKLSGTGLTAYNPKYFSVLPNKTIIITLFDTDPTAPTVAAGRLAYYDQDKNFLSVGSNIPIAKGSYKYVVPDNVSYFRISLFKYDDIRTKVEIGTLATDWTPAPEDIAFDYTDKDNQIKQTFTQYQQSNDGKVSKAQTDATQALGLVATKVSQTDFDTKTGDLSTKYNSVKQTVDEQANEIADIQTKDGSQDSKINSITSDVNGTKQNISDIQKSQSEQSTKINQITTDVNGTKQSITDIQAKDGQQDTRMGTIETSVSGVKSDFSTYKTDANGRISTAQTTAQTAVDGLNTKVSQTDYNTKTGQLQTDLTTTTQTANQAKTDIVSIKQTDTSQDSRMNTIESDASGTKQTVSQLQTVQGQQSGSISTLQQRADGFDATVTKVNNLAVGGRNYWSFTNKIDGQLIYPDGSITNSGSGLTAYNPNYFDIKQGQTVWVTIYNTISINNATLAGRLVYYDKDKNFISSTSDIAITQGNYKNIAPSNSAYFRISLFKYTNIKIKVEIGTLYTDWTPAPEDVDSATAKAQLTADQANTSLNAYKTDADGRITKAQSDITQTAKDVTTKVSQSDYNVKTGELTTSVSKAQQTADSAVTTIGSYKTSNDNRVKATETSIAQNAKDIALMATTSDLNAAKSDYTTKISQVQVNVDGISQSVSQVNTKVDGLTVGGRNYWSLSNKIDTKYIEQDGTIKTSGTGLTAYNPNYFSVSSGKTIIISILDTDQNAPTTLAGRLAYYDENKNFLFVTNNIPIAKGIYEKIVPSGVSYFRISLFKYLDLRTKVEIGDLPTDWTPAPEDVDNKFASQQITIDGITNTVSNQGTNISNLTSRVQTAEGTLSTATNNISGLQSKQTQTSNQISQEITDRANGDSNTLQSSKDFTQSSITSAVNGVNSTITQTSDSLIAKINTKTDSDTVLSLLKNNWSIGIADNIGAITSGIVGNSSSMSLISKNITLDGNTTVTGDFYAKGGNFTNLNASNITVGTLNGNQVNITNLNASNIVSGAISGANLNINLNTGQVQFQKGRIFKSDYTTDINIDQGYISTADSDNRVLLKGGQMQFVAPNVFDLQNTPYLKVYNGMGGSGNTFAGANLSGRDYIALYNSANSSNVFDAPIGTETFSGISTGKSSTGKWVPTKVGGADRGVLIAGGNTDNWLIVERSPYIFVGSDANGTSAYGNRVYVHADYFHVPTVYSHGGSTGANVYVASDGAILKSSSATKYKTNIEHETDSIQGDQLLTIDPATWNDKFESEQLERYHETGVEPERQINMEGKRYYGIIAEDLVKAGLEELVTRNEETDEVEGVEYSKIGVALIPIVRDLRNRLNEQYVEIERLKDKIK
ncbi:phage tail spike protein [Leuconostoc mesenteroides]|uniref:phage tail spike protein n=6 Tax=Leuconostoc mesenteroides TaxID=1245 RepID=UPI0023604946|nr:phage tail spike protein [Leuconostoc mesenteroides]